MNNNTLGAGLDIAALITQFGLFNRQMKNTVDGFNELLRVLKEQNRLLREEVNPYSGGTFHSDNAYDVPLNEGRQNQQIVTSGKRDEPGLVSRVTMTFYGSGGKRCSGAVWLDGGILNFEEIATMRERGLTEPLAFGWYVSSYDVAKNIYGATFLTDRSAPYEHEFRVFATNNNPRTATGTDNVLLNMETMRFRKNVVEKRSKEE